MQVFRFFSNGVKVLVPSYGLVSNGIDLAHTIGIPSSELESSYLWLY